MQSPDIAVDYWRAYAQWCRVCSGSRQDFRLVQVGLAETLDEFRYDNTRHLSLGATPSARPARSNG